MVIYTEHYFLKAFRDNLMKRLSVRFFRVNNLNHLVLRCLSWKNLFRNTC
jgi:hypothetical protein